MLKQKFVASLLVAISASTLHASVVEDSKCGIREQGAGAPALAFADGTFRGQCVDVSTVRPVKLLAEGPAAITVGGFYHQNKFWRAEVPKEAVAKVIFQVVPFASGVPFIKAAHNQLRFKLKTGKNIFIWSEMADDNFRASISDVIISSTYTAPPGVEYGVWKSRNGSFGIVTRFMSTEARGLEEIVKDKSIVRQFELILNDRDKNELLLHALRRASADGYSRSYALFTSNCTTITFDFIDQVHGLPTGIKPMRGSWWNLRDEFEGPSIQALKDRGLISVRSEIAPMNGERDWNGIGK